MDKDQARKNVEDYIKKCCYTYTVEQLIESYLEYYKKGFYVSYTTKDCINNLLDEFEVLTSY